MKEKAFLQEGKLFFASGQPEKSIPYFTAALGHGADPVIIGLSRGSANMALKRYADAKEDFTLAIDSDPGNERAYYFLYFIFIYHPLPSSAGQSKSTSVIAH